MQTYLGHIHQFKFDISYTLKISRLQCNDIVLLNNFKILKLILTKKIRIVSSLTCTLSENSLSTMRMFAVYMHKASYIAREGNRDQLFLLILAQITREGKAVFMSVTVG